MSFQDLNTCAPPFHRRSRFELHPRFQSLEQSTIWRSRTVEAKKLYMVAAYQAKRKALRFHRRYNLYGPPDWTDPALVRYSSYLLMRVSLAHPLLAVYSPASVPPPRQFLPQHPPFCISVRLSAHCRFPTPAQLHGPNHRLV
jgi:hypothetical protein